MGQGGAFVELITVRRGAYARRYIQTALKVVAINPRGSPFPVLATRLLSIPVFGERPSTRYEIRGINWRDPRTSSFENERAKVIVRVIPRKLTRTPLENRKTLARMFEVGKVEGNAELVGERRWA